MIRGVLVLLVLLLMVCGCMSAANVSKEVPAVLEQATDASRKALDSVLLDIFQRQVLVANDALTTSSLLVIEHRPKRSLGNTLAHGRIMEEPIELRLVTNGFDCILVDQRSQTRHLLLDTRCVVE